MPIKQTIPTNSGDYLQFGNATTPVAAQVGGYEDSTGNGHLELYTTASGTVTERVRVDANGNVMVGNTSALFSNTNRGVLNVNGTSQALISLSNGSSQSSASYLYWNGDLNITNNATTGNITFQTNAATERMRIDASGTLFLGQTTNPATGSMVVKVPTSTGNGINFQATGAATSYGVSFYNNTGGLSGYVSFSGTTTSYVTTSDYRLKENVQPMVGALSKVLQLKPVTYDWIETKESTQGFIAHELQEIVPECVVGEKDAVDSDGNPQYQGIDTSFLVATLTAAIQELNAKVTALEAQLGAK